MFPFVLVSSSRKLILLTVIYSTSSSDYQAHIQVSSVYCNSFGKAVSSDYLCYLPIVMVCDCGEFTGGGCVGVGSR